MRGDDLLYQQKVAMRILHGAKHRRDHFPRGVVNRRKQGEARPPPLQPVVRAGVDLDQCPGLCPPLTSLA